MSVRLPGAQVVALLDEAECTGHAEALWDEADRRPGVTDIRATVTYADGVWEVHRPGFSHGMHYHYLDDIHPVECTECYCRHWRADGHSHGLQGDPPSGCQCGHLTQHHRWRVIRDVIDVCTAPETWYTEEMRAFNALSG